jgi:hypothetical protein
MSSTLPLKFHGAQLLADIIAIALNLGFNT